MNARELFLRLSVCELRKQEQELRCMGWFEHAVQVQQLADARERGELVGCEMNRQPLPPDEF